MQLRVLWFCEPPKDSHQAWGSKGSSPCHSFSFTFTCNALQLAARMRCGLLILNCSKAKKASSSAPGWKAKPFIFSLYIYHQTCLFTSRLAMAECIGARLGRSVGTSQSPSHHGFGSFATKKPTLFRREPYSSCLHPPLVDRFLCFLPLIFYLPWPTKYKTVLHELKLYIYNVYMINRYASYLCKFYLIKTKLSFFSHCYNI